MIDTEKRLIVLADLTGIEAFEVILSYFNWKLTLLTTGFFLSRLDPLEREDFIKISEWQCFKGYIIINVDFLKNN